MNKTTIYTLIGLVVIIAGGVLFFSGNNSSDRTGDTSGVTKEKSNFDTVPDVLLFDKEGNEVALSSFRGQPLVLNSWAVWCPFCVDELPAFVSLQEEFEGEILVIAINRQESLEKTENYTDTQGLTDDLLFLLDPRDRFYKSVAGFSMPETLFVNSEGEVIVHKRGPMDLKEMRSHVNKILTNN